MKIQSKNAWAFVAHIGNLAKIAGIENYEALHLYNRLVRLEAKARRLSERECNEVNADFTKEFDRINKAIGKLFKPGNLYGFFINRDPRGYALKIQSDQRDIMCKDLNINLYQDMGGYGILAPEF